MACVNDYFYRNWSFQQTASSGSVVQLCFNSIRVNTIGSFAWPDFSKALHYHFHVITKYIFNNIIIPRARMGYESIAHEAEGQMGYWLRGYEGNRNNNCFSKIQLVGQKNIKTKYLSQVKARHQSSFTAKTLQIIIGGRFSLLVGYNIQRTSSSTNQNAALMTDH